MSIWAQVTSIPNGTRAEEWKPVPDYEGIYEVSSHGNVRRVRPGPNTEVGKILTPRLDTLGRPTVLLYNKELPKWRKEWRVHQLVARAFINAHPDPGLEVCHNNGNKVDNRAENLRWDTRKANHADKIVHGTSGINQNSVKTHCIRGHELSGDNLRIRRNSRTGNPMRNCRACDLARAQDPEVIQKRKQYVREYRARKKVAA